MKIKMKKVLTIALSAVMTGSVALTAFAGTGKIDIADSDSPVYTNYIVNGDFSDGTEGWHQGTRAGIDGLFDFDGAALPATKAEFATEVGTTVTDGKIDTVKNDGTKYTGTTYKNPLWSVKDVAGTDFESTYGKALYKNNGAEGAFRDFVDVDSNSKLGAYSGVYQDIEGLKPNTRYMLYFEVATEEANAEGSSNAAMVKVYAKSNGLVTDFTANNNGNAQGGSLLLNENKCSTNTPWTWTAFRKEFTTTAKEGEVYRLWLQAGNTYFDNFTLVEAPMSMNLLTNGDFEDTKGVTGTDLKDGTPVTKLGVAGWTPTTRLNETDKYTWATTRMINVVKDASDAHSGSTYISYAYDEEFSNYVDQSDDMKNRGRYPGFAQDVTVNASKAYTLSFWFRNEGVSAANVKVVDVATLDPGNSSNTNKFVNEQKVATPGEWTYFEKTFTLDTIDYTTPFTPTVDENGNTTIRVYIQGTQGTDMSCDYDDIALYEAVGASFKDTATGVSVDILRSSPYDYFAVRDEQSGAVTVNDVPASMTVTNTNDIFSISFTDADGEYDITGRKVKISLPRAESGTLKYYDSADETWYDVDANDIVAVGDNDVFTIESVDTLKFSYAANPGETGGDTPTPGGDTPSSGGDTPNPGNGDNNNTGSENTQNTGNGNAQNTGSSNATTGAGSTTSPQTDDSATPVALAVSAFVAVAAVVVLKKKLAV